MTMWLLDLDGVVWRGGEAIAGSVDAIRALEAAGHTVAYATNFSHAPVALAEERLARIGLSARGRVITSAQAAASLVAAGERALVVGGPGLVEALTARGAEVVEEGPADVVVAGYDPRFDYDRLTVAMRTLHGGARFVATNTDPTLPQPDGLLPGSGAIVAAIAAAAGMAPEVAGKPHRPMAELVRARFGDTGLMVGDQPATDGRFAVTLGYRFALVLSGVTTAADLPVEPVPDLVAADLAAVCEQLQTHAASGE